MRSLLSSVICFTASVIIVAAGTSCSEHKKSLLPLLGVAGGNSIFGVAAVGSPIVGTVYIKDSAGLTLVSQTDADGNFSIPVADMTGPFVIMIEGKKNGYGPDIRLYSYAVSAGRANITPVTNALVALAAGDVPEDVIDPDDMKADGIVLTLPADFQERLAEAADAFALILAPVVTDGFDLVSGVFSADGEGFDKLLDTLYITVDETTGSVTFGLKNEVIDTASISLAADLGDSATYQGAVDAIEDNADFINNPAFRMRYVAMFDGPGTDGIWFTGDDNCDGVMEFTSYPSGRPYQFYYHDGPGTDGDWYPTPLHPNAFDDNPSHMAFEATDDVNPVYTIGGATYQMINETGVDGTVRWRRTVTYDITDPLNPVPKSYNLITEVAETGQLLTYLVSDFLQDPRGLDGTLFTDDDPISTYSEYDPVRRVVIAYNGPGADGVWTTVGDNGIMGYYPEQEVVNGSTYSSYIYQAGPDTLWFTDDDSIYMRMDFYYEPVPSPVP